MEQKDLLTDEINMPALIRRRSLLPWWMKGFCWIFMVFGALTPFTFIAGLFGSHLTLSLYGMQTYEPVSKIGIIILVLFILKGVTSFALWMEKEWAVLIGLLDAILGILICFFIMIILPFIDDRPGFNFNFRLELFLLFPYLMKLFIIKPKWREAIAGSV